MNKNGTKIYLNVYDLTSINYYLHSFGLGAYHSGVQIDCLEYSFGHHEGIDFFLWYKEIGLVFLVRNQKLLSDRMWRLDKKSF